MYKETKKILFILEDECDKVNSRYDMLLEIYQKEKDEVIKKWLLHEVRTYRCQLDALIMVRERVYTELKM